MKRIGVAWRVVVWLLAIGWIPVAADALLNRVFHIDERFYEYAILVIPYMEFISLPLTILAVVVALFTATNATVRLFQNNKSSNRAPTD